MTTEYDRSLSTQELYGHLDAVHILINEAMLRHSVELAPLLKREAALKNQLRMRGL